MLRGYISHEDISACPCLGPQQYSRASLLQEIASAGAGLLGNLILMDGDIFMEFWIGGVSGLLKTGLKECHCTIGFRWNCLPGVAGILTMTWTSSNSLLLIFSS